MLVLCWIGGKGKRVDYICTKPETIPLMYGRQNHVKGGCVGLLGRWTCLQMFGNLQIMTKHWKYQHVCIFLPSWFNNKSRSTAGVMKNDQSLYQTLHYQTDI